MDFQFLLTALITLAIIEVVSDVLKKTPLWLSKQCVAAFRRLWQESKYLYGIVKKKRRFAQWNPEAGRYVALRANAESTNQKIPEHVLDSLESFLGSGESVVLLGEPGAGKTTVLEALTYRLARRAYRSNILLWLGLLLVAALLLLVTPLLSLGWLVSFFLWESFARRTAVPIFLEAREYPGGKVADWCAEEIRKYLGETPLFRSHHRVVLLVDGVNEVHTDRNIFMQGWRTHLKNQRHVVFTSRTDEDPTLSLGLKESNKLILRHLDDDGVREFLQIYGRKKAADEGKSYPPEQATDDFAELQNKKLLDEKGIGRNPYWLRMMVASGLYTRNRGAIFRSFAEKLIAREIEEKPEGRKRRRGWEKIVRLNIEMDALAGLALAMHQQQSTVFTGEAGWQKARMAIRERLGDDSPYLPDDVLGEAEAATLVRTQYKERIEFTHQLLQEFFAAYALRMEEKWDEALQHCEDLWWWRTLLLLGNLLDTSESGMSKDFGDLTIQGDWGEYPPAALKSWTDLSETDDSSEAWTKFIRRVLGDGQNTGRLFLAIGLLQSAETPGWEIKRTVLDALEASIGEELTETQIQAVRELAGILGDEALEAFAPLLEWGQSSRIQRWGIALLHTMGGKRAAELLLGTLYAQDLHEDGAAALVAIGEPAIDPLIAVLLQTDNLVPPGRWYETPFDEVRKRAMATLRQIGHLAIGSLITMLQNEDEIVWYARRLARRALIDRGIFQRYGHEQNTFPMFLKGGSAYYWAAEALGQIGTAAIEPLIAMLRDESFSTREGAISSFIRLVSDVMREDKDFSVRERAVIALAEIGAPAVSTLIGALQDKEWRVRLIAAYALGQIGDHNAVEPLIAALRDRVWRVRLAAAEAVGEINDAHSVEPLKKAMQDRVKLVRLQAAAILAQTGDPLAIELLVDALGSRNWRMREKVREAIGKVGSSAIELLIPILQDRNWRKRFDAVYVLGQIGDPCAVEPLIAVLRSKNHGVSQWVAMLSRKLADRIERGLDDNDSFLRREGPHEVGLKVLRYLAWGNATEELCQKAAEALGQIGSPDAVEALSTALGDENPRLWYKAVDALRRIGTPAAPPLINALQHKDSYVRKKAVDALGQIGDPCAVEPIVAVLQARDEDTYVSWLINFSAVEALGKIGDPRAVGPLLDNLRNFGEMYYWRNMEPIAEALGQIENPSAIEPLITALRDEDWHLRWAAVKALGNIGGRGTVEPLVAVIRNEDHQDVLWSAEEALVQIGAPAIEPLIAMLGDEDKYIRSCAGGVLVQIGAPAVELLITALQNPDANVRRRVMGTIAGIFERMKIHRTQVSDPHIVDSMIAALRDPDRDVCLAATMILNSIGAPAVERLIAVLGDDKEETSVRYRVLMALAEIVDRHVFEQLFATSSGKNEYIRWRRAKAFALRELGAGFLRSLIDRLQDEDPFIRMGAAEMLGQVGDPDAVTPLIAALQDELDEVRYRAARALGQIGDPRALLELERMGREDTGKALQGDVADAAREAVEKIRQRMQ